MDNPEKFKVKTVELIGNNTIEASAGTGKTYSLAVLVVRLLLEKPIKIEQILLVTFTEAAAAELKERTAKFIRLALKEVNKKGSSGNKDIEAIVDHSNLDAKNKKELFNQALLDLDKATMATIHSFCQQTLTEFAFETEQSFGKELIKDTSEILNQVVEDYIRINSSLFSVQIDGIKSILVTALNDHLNGKTFWYDSADNKSLELVDELIQNINENLSRKSEHFTPELRSKIKNDVKNGNLKGRGPKENKKQEILSALESPSESFKLFEGKDVPKYIQNSFLGIYEDVNEISNALKSDEKELKTILIRDLLGYAPQRIESKLKQKNALTFNDLIDSLYQKRDNKDLIKLMREKYKAVFVDEFQDTDPKQYGIFKSFFQDDENTVLFFIGDPKQSIYGWRQADIATYIQARKSQNMERHHMNKNYRSSAPFIEAANTFFKLDKESSLKYKEVGAKDTNQEVGLKQHGNFLPAIQLIEGSKDPEEFTQKVFTALFDTGTQLNNKHVSPENIAILVRKGAEGIKTKRILDKLKIPSVIITDQNVFATQEAKNLKVILNAVLNINQGNVFYALITSLVGIEINQLQQVNKDTVFPIFYECKSIWQKDGISKMMANFMQAFNVISKHGGEIIKGHQILANTKQLIDILQKHTIEQALTPTEVYHFLSDQIKNPDTNNEAYQQTVENDEKAVKIMTIHKSKGLEFDVVVLPYLSVTSAESSHWKFTSFREKSKDSNENKYYFALNGLPEKQKELFEAQTQAENERLLYVAVTRAKYNAYIFGKKTKTGNHLLKPYFDKAPSTANLPAMLSHLKLDEFSDVENEKDGKKNQSSGALQKKLALGDLKLADENYFKMSYSFLAKKHKHHRKEETATPEENTYDHFIFKELPRGAHIGNVLHDMFEFSDFTNDASWSENIEKALGRYYPSCLQKEEIKERYIKNLLQLMKLTVETKFEINGQPIRLNQVDNQHRVNELEFNFPIPELFQPTDLEKLVSDENDPRSVATSDSKVYGMMNGFVDLFFKHNGKYYILDWKSNFLGDKIEDYSKEGLIQGMNESNYHLQYLLYTVAIDKYLSNRLGEGYNFEEHFGGVCYVFLRGVRDGEEIGFFVQDVKKEELEKMKEIIFTPAVRN